MTDWIQTLLQRCAEAGKRLEQDKSEEAYKGIISNCYWLVLGREQMEDMGGFSDILRVYERAVLEFWEQYQTTESLCQVIYFYSDGETACCMGDMPEMKAHLKKGLPYAKLYHEREDKDYSACMYVDIYLKLYEACRAGEEAEQLGYVGQACSLARKYAMKYRTLQMLEEYHLAVKEFVAYQRLYGQDEEAAAEKEREYEAFSAALEGGVVQETEKRQEEMFHNRPNIYTNLEKLRCQALPHSLELVAEHRQEIFQCIRVCLKLQKIAHYQGLESLQRAGNQVSEGNALYRKILAYGIQLVCDGSFESMEVSEKVLEHFHTGEDRYEGFMLYLCTAFLNMIQNGYAARIMQQVLLSMLPVKERDSLLKYLKYKPV